MNVNDDLIGKTITGVIASAPDGRSPRQIWMLQFSDGTHVEFVSPGSRRALQRSAERPGGSVRARAQPDQLTLSVA